MPDAPPLPPVPPLGQTRLVDDEGRATAEFTQWLAKLLHYLGHISEVPKPARSDQSLADWLRANVP